MITKFRKFFGNKKGQGLVEYALILGLVAVVVIVGITALGTATNGRMSGVAASVSG